MEEEEQQNSTDARRAESQEHLEEHLSEPDDPSGRSVDLHAILSTVELATLILDGALRILYFTPSTRALLNLRKSDRGRRISDIAHRLGYQHLESDAKSVLRDRTPLERELEDYEGRWYLSRLMPCRTDEEQVDGIVVTLTEITGRKKLEEDLRRLNASLEQTVHKRNLQVRDLAGRLTMAEQEERHRIARTLHDDLQQVLYGVGMKLERLSKDLTERNLSGMAHETEKVREWVERAVNTTRRLTADLTPPILQSRRLTDILDWLAQQMMDLHGLRVGIEAEQDVQIEEEGLRILLMQVVRELLFNVIKHANVDEATVRVREAEGHLVIHVIDAGRGFDVASANLHEVPASGFGLPHARERLQVLGGDLLVRARPGDGTRVEVHVPIRPRDQ